jgi:uncharacterized protein YwgA
MIYLCKTAGQDFNEHYIYHYYGPYSFELSQEIDELVRMDIIKEEETRNVYKYKITRMGDALYKQGLLKAKIEPERLDQLQRLCKEINTKDVPFLEVASTAAFLKENGYSDSDIPDKTKELKGEVIKNNSIDLKEAISFSEKLNKL